MNSDGDGDGDESRRAIAGNYCKHGYLCKYAKCWGHDHNVSRGKFVP